MMFEVNGCSQSEDSSFWMQHRSADLVEIHTIVRSVGYELDPRYDIISLREPIGPTRYVADASTGRVFVIAQPSGLMSAKIK